MLFPPDIAHLGFERSGEDSPEVPKHEKSCQKIDISK